MQGESRIGLQIARSDPHFESPKAAGRRFRAALLTVGAFVLLLWAVLALDLILEFDLRSWGVRPWTAAGLVGVFTMPLLHGGPTHLLHNTLPALMLGTALLYFYPQTRWRVLPWFWLLPGLFVWFSGAHGSTHFGASGLNFALLGYLGLGGLLRRDVATLAVSMAVMFYYGGMLSGVLPIEEGVSWEGHLGGLLTGIALAVGYRRRDIIPRKRYDWEDEDLESDEPEPAWTDGSYGNPDEPAAPPSRTLH